MLRTQMLWNLKATSKRRLRVRAKMLKRKKMVALIKDQPLPIPIHPSPLETNT